MTAGIDFYRKVLGLQLKHKPAGKTILNGIQTNGTLIDEEWSRFFAENGFIVGISIDGPAEYHNSCRRTKDDRPNWERVMDGIRLLFYHGVVPEVLCVVNSENVRQPEIIYNFCRQLGARYITFLPLVKTEAGSVTGVTKESVPAEAFGYFLSRIFDQWVENDIGNIKIQIFEEASRVAFNQEHTLCIFKVNCGGVPVVEFNGDFYPCDHYVDNEHNLGNIREKSLAFFIDSKRQREFGLAKSNTLPGYCIECEVRQMCNGECPKNRFILSPEGEPGLNYLCKGYKYFFNHCKPFVEAIAQAYNS
jgi:uncharacterized protein